MVPRGPSFGIDSAHAQNAPANRKNAHPTRDRACIARRPQGCFIVWHFRALSCTRKFFPTHSNEGCTFLATTLYTLHRYAVNIVINTWLATAQQDRAAIADSSGPRLTLLRHSYTELWLRAHTNLFVMGLFDSLCWLL